MICPNCSTRFERSLTDAKSSRKIDNPFCSKRCENQHDWERRSEERSYLEGFDQLVGGLRRTTFGLAEDVTE